MNGLDKYDVNEDEEFLNHLKSENAFAYYLIRNSQKRKYNKKSSQYFNDNDSETNQGYFRKGLNSLENPLVRDTIKYAARQGKRIVGGIGSGIVGEIREKVKNSSGNVMHKLIGNKKAKKTAEILYKGTKRASRII